MVGGGGEDLVGGGEVEGSLCAGFGIYRIVFWSEKKVSYNPPVRSKGMCGDRAPARGMAVGIPSPVQRRRGACGPDWGHTALFARAVRM